MDEGNAGMRARKPMLSVGEQIEHLKSRGVRFELCSEDAAARYLERANNYLRVAAYRKLYPRQVDGPSPGSYITTSRTWWSSPRSTGACGRRSLPPR